MTTTNMKKILLLSALTAFGLQQATAQVTAVDLGTGAPPATLGGYTMTTFDPGSIGGESYTATEVNGSGTTGWSTWGQNYTGNVYAAISPDGATSSGTLTLTLSGGTEAVDFYEEPNQFSDFYMTATDSSGATVTTLINGYHGSEGVGFYENTPGGDYLTSITVTCTDPTGFAIGEFGINGGTLTGQVGTAPDTGSTLAFLALGLGGMLAYSRFSRVTA
jgi:hypothetical protein